MWVLYFCLGLLCQDYIKDNIIIQILLGAAVVYYLIYEEKEKAKLAE